MDKKSEVSPSAEFLKIAKSKWGRRWRQKSAAALSVHPVTVWRWTRPNGEPPAAVMIALRSIAVAKKSLAR